MRTQMEIVMGATNELLASAKADVEGGKPAHAVKFLKIMIQRSRLALSRNPAPEWALPLETADAALKAYLAVVEGGMVNA